MESAITKVYSCADEMQAKVVCSYLQAQGINAFLRGLIPFAHPVLQLQLFGGSRMIQVCVPTVDAAAARTILETFSLEDASQEAVALQDRIESTETPFEEEASVLDEEQMRALAVFRDYEDADTCFAFLSNFGFEARLKYYEEEERHGLPQSSMSVAAPYHLLVAPADWNMAGDKLLTITLPEGSAPTDPQTSWSCPECGTTNVLLSHDPLKRNRMKKLLAFWSLGLPFLFILASHIPNNLWHLWFLGVPIWFFFTHLFANNRSCLYCKNIW